MKPEKGGIYRSEKSGLNEELVYNAEGTGLFFLPKLLFPGGQTTNRVTAEPDTQTVTCSKSSTTLKGAEQKHLGPICRCDPA
jgi:hypothetical protein